MSTDHNFGNTKILPRQIRNTGSQDAQPATRPSRGGKILRLTAPEPAAVTESEKNHPHSLRRRRGRETQITTKTTP